MNWPFFHVLADRGASGDTRDAIGRSPDQTIAKLLEPGDILLNVLVAGRDELMDEIGQFMEWTHHLPAESVRRSLSHRERIHSTAVGNGVAFPHARIGELDHIQLSYLALRFPIPFEAPDGIPVSDIFVLLVPKVASQDHLPILAQASSMFSDPQFRRDLHDCVSAPKVKEFIDDWQKRCQTTCGSGNSA